MIKKILIFCFSIIFCVGLKAQNNNDSQHLLNNGNNLIGLNVNYYAYAFHYNLAYGINYERLIGKKQHIGIVLPISYSPPQKIDYSLITYGDLIQHYSYLFLSPGLKFYPFGQRKITYVIGSNLLAKYTWGSEYIYSTTLPQNTKNQYLIFGLIFRNYLRFNIYKFLNCSIIYGLGTLPNRYYDYNIYGQRKVVQQVSLNFDYRF